MIVHDTQIRLCIATCLFTILNACATTPPPPVDHIVYRDNPVPYREPCPAASDIPAQPNRVAAEHPTMPAGPPLPTDLNDTQAWFAALNAEIIASHERERILGAKVLQWITYGERASAVMAACSKASPPPG